LHIDWGPSITCKTKKTNDCTTEEPQQVQLCDQYLRIVQKLGVDAEDRLCEWKTIYAMSPEQAVLAIVSLCRKTSRGDLRDPNAFFTSALSLARRRSETGGHA
jgi:hypothetical protein